MASATVRLVAVTVSILIIVASFIGINLFQGPKKPCCSKNLSGIFIAYKTHEKNFEGQKVFYRTQIIFDGSSAGKR